MSELVKGKKRPRGQGRVFQPKNSNVWWLRYRVNKKQIRESSGETDQSKAEKLLTHRLKEIGADDIGARTFTLPKNQKLTIHDLLEALKRDFELRGKLSNQNKSGLKRADADFGTYRAMGLTADKIDAYVQRRVAEGDRPATINRISQMVGQAYRLAIAREELNHMPHIRLLPEAGNERKGFFSREEFDRVSAALPGELADFALFGYLTGWRKGEIASLTWQDVEDGVIRLRGENAKNGEARQVVIAGELSALMERRKQARLANGVLTALVFHRDGAPVADFRKAWASACKKAGVPGRIFHDFRRTAVRDMIRSGVSQNVAMKISGHKTTSMFRRYDIVNEDDLRQAMELRAKYHEATAKKVISMGQP